MKPGVDTIPSDTNLPKVITFRGFFYLNVTDVTTSQHTCCQIKIAKGGK